MAPTPEVERQLQRAAGAGFASISYAFNALFYLVGAAGTVFDNLSAKRNARADVLDEEVLNAMRDA